MNFMKSHMYRPDRILYYLIPSKEEIENFYKGILPENLSKYEGVFGTYDSPGLFRICLDNNETEVLGIEFRPDDSRIDYPKNLSSIKLEHSFMISSLCSDDSFLNDELLTEIVEDLKKDLDMQIFRRGIKLKKNSNFVQVFTSYNNNRILLQAEDIPEEIFFEPILPQTENEKKLNRIAYEDFITGHHNWNFIWPITAGYGYKGIQDFAFVLFDVKDFKAINVVYGHEVANKVLRKIVESMNCQDWIYYSARCDNDNFVMMIKDMPEQEMKNKLELFFKNLSVLDEDKHYHIYYRCGVVPMKNAIQLGDRVADAGKQVKKMGNKSYETEILFYTDEMHVELNWSSKIKAYLDTAIEKEEFLVYLQPKYDIHTETIHGAEALIRWKYYGRELLSPGKFIPIFEQGGLISKLDDIVLKKVCQCFVNWKQQGLPLYPISVNLSRKRMANPNLVEHLTSIVDSFGVDHSLIDFELTESAAYDNQNIMTTVIKELKKKGFKISMDDFGTGYSTLSLLTTMPMDTIKIDKSFVDGIELAQENDKECILLKNIIILAKELKFTCLAEGAECKSQIDKLRNYGCEIIQGFYYSKPLPINDYEALLQKQNQ